MKSLLIISAFLIIVLASCTTQKFAASNDDVYADPKEDRINEARIAAEKKQAQEARNKRINDSTAAVAQMQKEKDDANPNYKDREFKYDDYYDYEYATRVKRFDNNINGLSYYDNYYTNSYWYNQNPYTYGVSVYNGYSWWGQSYNNYSYNPTVTFYSGYGWGNYYGGGGYNGYNPYNPYASAYWQGYNNGYNNAYYHGLGGYPYGAYGYNGYNNYNNGWGYYNSYDNNSGYTNGPRASHTGGNSRRTSNPGEVSDSFSDKYISSVGQLQATQPRFSNLSSFNVKGSNPRLNGATNGNSTTVKQPAVDNTNIFPTRNTGNATSTNPTRQYGNQETVPVKQQPAGTETKPVKQFQEQPVKKAPTPVKQNEQPVKQYEAPVQQNVPMQIPTNNNGGGRGTPSGNNGGGRPR